jgi:putative ABC transport system ATP-binding protein
VTLFTAQNLSAGFGEKTLFRDLSFKLLEGQILAIQGPSGSGKSTLLRILSGLDNPLTGQVLLNDQRPADLGWPQYRRRVIHLSQQAAFKDMSVLENLKRIFQYRGVVVKFPQESLLHLFETLNLDPDLLEQDALTLSVGQQQRIALIRALLPEPSVILLDEATSALDKDNQRRAESLLQTRASRGLGIIFVSHDPLQLKRFSNTNPVTVAGPQAESDK